MEFKRGDKVRVRQWKAMEREYGLDKNGDIDLPCKFTSDMRDFCGKVVTISCGYEKFFGIKDHEGVYDLVYKIKEDDGICDWLASMFEGYAFEYGDVIEVSDDGVGWVKRIYVGYIDGALFPYMCVANGEEIIFHSGKKFNAYYWKYARPIQRKHTIVIDGKEIEISEESYKKLKESLLK